MASKRVKIGSNAIIYTVLALGILVLINLIASRVYRRIDLTEDKIFTISAASKKLVSGLPDRLNVKAFISADLPPDPATKARYLRDILHEYATASGGKFDWEVLDPSADDKLVEQARRLKVPPVRMRYYEKNKVSEREAFLGVSFQFGGKVESLRFVNDIYTLEYRISSTIRRLTQKKKKVAFTSGHGEPGFQRGLKYTKQMLKDYEVVSVDLTEGKKAIPDDVDILVIAGPTKPMAERAKYEIDKFLMKGKSVALLVDGMTLQTPRSQGMQQQQMIQIARENVTGLEQQFEYYGVKINHDMVMNPSIQVLVQTQMGIPMPAALPPPFVGIKQLNRKNPITRDMKEYVSVFPCSLNLTKEVRDGKAGRTGTVLASSGPESWRKKGFFILNPRKPAPPTKERGPFNVAIYMQGSFKSYFDGRAAPPAGPARGPTEKAAPKPSGKGKPSPSSARLVVVAGAGFARDQFVQMLPTNLDLLLNLVDVLAQDESLIAIRAKSRIKRPLEIKEETNVSLLKWANITLLPVLFVAFGVARWRWRLVARRRRAEELTGGRPAPTRPSAKPDPEDQPDGDGDGDGGGDGDDDDDDEDHKDDEG